MPSNSGEFACLKAEEEKSIFALKKTPNTGRNAKKANQILSLLREDPVDISALRRLSVTRNGLVNDKIRRTVWPKLVGADVPAVPQFYKTESLQTHSYYRQVVLDVERSTRHFPPGLADEERESLKDRVTNLIVQLLLDHPELHYYQGFHELTISIVLVMGDIGAYAVLEKLVLLHLKDFMEETMEKTTVLLSYLPRLLHLCRPELAAYMEKATVGTIFCLSWVITWFSHVLTDLPKIYRLIDFFLASHPLMPLYLSAAIVVYREEEIFQTDCEMPALHSLLSRLPENLPWEELLSIAGDLFCFCPPSELLGTRSSSWLRFDSILSMARKEVTASQIRHRIQTVQSINTSAKEAQRPRRDAALVSRSAKGVSKKMVFLGIGVAAVAVAAGLWLDVHKRSYLPLWS